MRNRNSIAEDIKDMLLDYIANSEEIGYCDSCPLKYHDETGLVECPYFMDMTCCEKNPCMQLDNNIEDILLTIEACMP